MDTIRHILVVTRLSQYCRDAVNIGISLAKKYDAKLSLLHLITNPVDMEALNAPLPYPDERHKSYGSVEEQAKEEIDGILRREIGSGQVVKVLVREERSAEDVVQVVTEEGIDLMVMLAHQEGVLEHLLFGRDNDAIIRRMPCSILLVKKEPGPVKW